MGSGTSRSGRCSRPAGETASGAATTARTKGIVSVRPSAARTGPGIGAATDCPVSPGPGVTVSATLQIVNVAVYPSSSCGPVSVNYIQVYPPGQTSPSYVPYTSYTHEACSKPIYQLGVSTVAPGTAILP